MAFTRVRNAAARCAFMAGPMNEIDPKMPYNVGSSTSSSWTQHEGDGNRKPDTANNSVKLCSTFLGRRGAADSRLVLRNQ